MTIILIIYILISIYGIHKQKDKNAYLSKEETTNIKGIFTIMILMSHFRDYTNLDSGSIYVKILSLFGQLMVTMFLFYSGYGIMESLTKKKNYMKSFFCHRFLKTLIHFDLAVIIYIIVSLIMGNNYRISSYLLSFIGWTSVGNSNWFMFVILGLYLITYISNITFSKNKLVGLISTTLLSFTLIGFLYFFKEGWWYNIILCYPCGMWYSYFKEKIENIVLEKYKYVSLILITIIFIFLYKFSHNVIIYELLACIFCLLVINFTYIFHLGNKILSFLGLYSFEIYILQRIPYNVLSKVFNNNLIFFVISLVCTIIISIMFKYLTDFIDKKMYRKVA